MMKSTLRWDKILRISRKSGVGFFTPEPFQRTHVLLKDLQTLRRRQGQHPTNEGEIYSILTVGEMAFARLIG
jgi:hypothetical protein